MRLKLLILLSLAACLVLCSTGCRQQAAAPGVVVYTAHDQIYSEPILQEFTRNSGLPVRPVYDTEATKTVGLINRIIAEARHPQCDVLWNNEIVRTLVLKRKGLLDPFTPPDAAGIPESMRDPAGIWYGFAARARVLICNTNLVPIAQQPASILELTNAAWKGKVALAYPLFGTTATHAAALFSLWGDDAAKSYYRHLKANGIVIAEGNAAVKDMVARGEVPLGFTDTDDAASAVQQGRPVAVLYPDQGPDQIGTLVIPNTLALIKGRPHPDIAQRLADHLLSPQVEAALARSGSAQMPLRSGVPVPEGVRRLDSIKPMRVDWERVADRVSDTAAFLGELFVR